MTTADDLPSCECYETAAANANAILAASPVMGKMLAVRTTAIRLIRTVDHQILNELEYGWDVDAKPIAELLVAASHQQTLRNPGTIEDLRRGVWKLVMPVLDALVMMERADAERVPTGE